MSVHGNGRVARILLPPQKTFQKFATTEAKALPPYNTRSFKTSFLIAIMLLVVFSIITSLGLLIQNYKILRYIGMIGNGCVILIYAILFCYYKIYS